VCVYVCVCVCGRGSVGITAAVSKWRHYYGIVLLVVHYVNPLASLNWRFVLNARLPRSQGLLQSA